MTGTLRGRRLAGALLAAMVLLSSHDRPEALEVIQATLAQAVRDAEIAAVGVMTLDPDGAASLVVHEVLAGRIPRVVDVVDADPAHFLRVFANAAGEERTLRGVFLLARAAHGEYVPAATRAFAPLSQRARVQTLLTMRHDASRFIRDRQRWDDEDLVHYVGAAFSTPVMRCGDGPAVVLSGDADRWKDTTALWFDKRPWRLVVRIATSRSSKPWVWGVSRPSVVSVAEVEPGPIPELAERLREVEQYRSERGDHRDTADFVCQVDSRLPARALGISATTPCGS